MNQRGFALAGLLIKFWPYIAIALLSFGLYWQIGKTAQQKEYNKTLIGVNQAQTESIARMERESQLSEVVLVAHAGKVETITEVKEVEKVRVREVIRNAPPESCSNTDADPVIVNCLLNDACTN